MNKMATLAGEVPHGRFEAATRVTVDGDDIVSRERDVARVVGRLVATNIRARDGEGGLKFLAFLA